MKKTGKHLIFGAAAAIVLNGAVLCGAADCRAAGEDSGDDGKLIVGEVYRSAKEELYGDTFRSVYENRLPGSPLEAECADGVDTATGHLMLSRNDLSLEGTGGNDFELDRYYDSNEANLGHATVEYVEALELETMNVYYTAEDGSERRLVVHSSLLANHKDALKNLMGVSYEARDTHRSDQVSDNTQRTRIVSNRGHNVYGIASGWRYDFPWIETVTLSEDEGWGKRPAYLHYGSAGVINIETEADAGTKTYRITGLEDYQYSDVRLEDWDKTVDGIPCKYLLRDKTGLRTYFNEDGVIV